MKPIKLTEQMKEAYRNKFEEFLSKEYANKNKITFDTGDVLFENAKTPAVVLSLKAYTKIRNLITVSGSNEVGFHGIVSRPYEGIYFIDDIMVYPQTVTATTVTVDETEYLKWQETLDDDTFNMVRFQGHTHPNFSVTPSGTDEVLYDKFLRTLKGDDFYIFMIINKESKMWFKVYDFAQNIIFENEDIISDIADEDGNLLSKWLEDAKECISETKKVTHQGNIRRNDNYYYSYREMEDDLYGLGQEPSYSWTPKSVPVNQKKRGRPKKNESK